MAQATIVIGNLESPALYVTSFHAEIFSDSAYTQLVGSKASSAKVGADGNWVQSDLISFSGLLRGQTYYIQAGPVSPGGAANFNRFAVQAGILTIPSCGFTGTFTASSAGITYDITPTNVPSDLDHYEAIWTKDGSAPSNSSLDNAWEGSALPNGLVHIFVGGAPNQTIHFYMRAISATGGYQNWVAVDSRTISAAATTTSGSTSASNILYANGVSVESLKPATAGADVTSLNISADTSAVNGINSGHIADTATSVGFVGKWWRTSSSNLFPVNGGDLNYAPMFTTNDAQINYNIYTYSSFVGSVIPPSFAPYGPNNDGKYIYVRWVGYFICSNAGSYSFGTSSDDGANLYVNGTKIIADMSANGHGTSGNLNPDKTGSYTMAAGATYQIVVEYYNNAGGAGIQVMYTPPGSSGWQLLNLGTVYKNAGYLTYSTGTSVDALMPAAAGADVTSVNVSADTSAVNGRAAADVAQTILAGGGTNYLHTGNINTPQNANNLLIRGSFEDGSAGTWGPSFTGVGAVTNQDFSSALVFSARDTFEVGNNIPVTAGQRLYCYGSLYTANQPSGYATTSVGYAFKNSKGQYIAFEAAYTQPSNVFWTPFSGFVTVPSGAVSCTPWLQNSAPGGTDTNLFAWVADLFYTKTAVVDFSETTHINKNATYISYSTGASVQSLQPAQPNADVTGLNTANNTNNVSTVPASTIANVIPNGYTLLINSGNRTYSITAV